MGIGDAPLFLGLLLGVGVPIALLVMEPYKRNPLAKFHAFQGLFVSGAIICLYIIVRIFANMFASSLSMFMFTMFKIIFSIYAILPLIVCGLLTMKAFQNQKWVVPILGPIAEKQAYKQ